MAGADVGTIDDTLDDIARQNGKVEVVLSADDINAAYLKVNPTHEPPFTPGTMVYRITYTGNARFVRVFSDFDGMAKGWIMNADDIVGFTAAEIQDKFSIPGKYPPTQMCEVTVPSGTALEISSANGILGHNGGGVQYRVIGKLDDLLYNNARTIK